MEKQKNRQTQFMAVSMCVFVVINLTLIFQFVGRTNTRITDQNQRYLEDDSKQSLKTLDSLFHNAVSDITMISRLYEQQMDSSELINNELNSLEDRTIFDYVRFVDKEGFSHAKDGSVRNCADRDYYTEGMKGNSGVTFIQKSRFISSRTLLFYAPYHEGVEVAGVLVGIFDEEHLRKLISSTYFGSQASEYLCLRDGTIVASSKENSPDNLLDDLEENGSLSDTVMKELRQAFEEGNPYSFNYMESIGIGNGCVTTLANSDWVLLRTFPASAGNQIRSSANRDVMRFEMKMVVVYLAYIVVFALYYVGQNSRLRRKSESYSQIVNSVKKLYVRFVVFDFENNTYEYLKTGNLDLQIPKSGDYFEWLNTFPSSRFAEEDAERFLEEFSPENLKNNLNLDNHFIQYEYEVKGTEDVWDKYSLIKLNMDEDDTTRVLAAVEDVSALRKEELEKRRVLEAAFRDAESANNAKMDFLSRMSHDIRTPMNAIIGLTAIASAHMDDKDRISDCLTKISSSGKHLLSLINEVLDMSKIESGKFSLSEEEFNFSELVDDTIEIIRPSVNEKHHNFTVYLGNMEHEDVIGDSLRVRQIFVNILSNSVKYTKEGGDITLTISEKPDPRHMLSTYEIIFEDNGIGMSREYLKRLYVPFERAEDVRTSKIQGTGLGMPIVRNIVRAMDGTIKVESEPGKGTKFTVVISLKHQNVEQVTEQRLSGQKVLVVDDDEIACESTCMVLQELGMEGSWVLSGKEAVAAVEEAHKKEQDYYAVILDWQMPDMDGGQTAKAIREKAGAGVPIIFVSAFDYLDVENEVRALGVETFISKPLFKSKLQSALVGLMPEENRQEDKGQLAQMGELDFSGRRALLVEDNEINMEIAMEILGMTGLTLETAENGKRCVEMFSEAPEGWYSVIFMDIQMPVMNGYEAATAIRALPREDAKDIPIIAMTANAFSEDVQDALSYGMNEHIAKPLDLERLQQVLTRWL